MQVGLVVMDENPADALKIVRSADRAGVHSLWSIDYYNRSSLTRAANFAGGAATWSGSRTWVGIPHAEHTRPDLPSQLDRTPS